MKVLYLYCVVAGVVHSVLLLLIWLYVYLGVVPLFRFLGSFLLAIEAVFTNEYSQQTNV